LQVLGFGGQRLADQLDGERPIGDLALMPPLALRTFVFLAAGFLDLVVCGGVLEIFARGTVGRNRVQQIIA